MTEFTYRYPAKDTVRAAWMDSFLPASFPNPDTTTGLYLPARENIEFDGYIAKGMRPEMLVGAECEAEEFPFVQANSRGIRMTSGPAGIFDAVDMMMRLRMPPLTFANLDFTGDLDPVSPEGNVRDLLRLFRIFPARPEAFLACTIWPSRNQSALAHACFNVCKFFSGLDDMRYFHDSFDRLLSRERELNDRRKTRERKRGAATVHTHVSRELGFLWWILMGLGMGSPDRTSYRSLDEEFLAQVDPVTDAIREKAERMEDLTAHNLIANFDLAHILKSRRCGFWPTDFQRYTYLTQNSNTMRTWFLRIAETDSRTSLHQVMVQLWELAVRAPLLLVVPDGSIVKLNGK